MRIEKDYIGTKEIPDAVLYGIHSLRAKENFPDTTPFFPEWYKAVGLVKLACYLSCKNFFQALKEKYGELPPQLKLMKEEHLDVLIAVAGEISEGKYFDNFIVPAVNGGAGTSINMNINEIIANASLLKLGNKPGNYELIDPIEHVNIFQSTNDVIPTSLKLAIMLLLNDLEGSINQSRNSIETLENRYRNTLRTGYTQMQEAVPTSYGKLSGTYSEAFSRDWWRISKCFETIKVVNLGGSAIGTGVAVPRFFIRDVVQTLQIITGLPVTRSENLADATSNLDIFVEIHAILKAHAVNLEKIVSDLRLLAADIVSQNEIRIPNRQVGSSIMPGKINPVIPEFTISAAHKIYANDVLITSLCAQGCLELNAYIPVIGHALLDSLKLLIACNTTLKNNLFDGLEVLPLVAENKLFLSPAITAALIPYIGYHQASQLARVMKTEEISIFEANALLSFIDEEKLRKILKPEQLLKLGFTIEEIL
jgi:aspartate ammonia-lyase